MNEFTFARVIQLFIHLVLDVIRSVYTARVADRLTMCVGVRLAGRATTVVRTAAASTTVRVARAWVNVTSASTGRLANTANTAGRAATATPLRHKVSS